MGIQNGGMIFPTPTNNKTGRSHVRQKKECCHRLKKIYENKTNYLQFYFVIASR